ncbi:hypothetical protein Bca4012_094755 [Brassica carinata]
MGKEHEITTLQSEEFILQPEHMQSTRYDAEGHLDALVQWKGLSVHERDIDKSWRCYYCKRLKKKSLETDVDKIQEKKDQQLQQETAMAV